MPPSFTYPELQRKFCEGFAFFPFNALEQHNNFIYKRYTAEDNTSQVLDHQYEEYNFNSRHAALLLTKLAGKDIPVTDELLLKLQDIHSMLQKSFRALRNRTAIYLQLLEAIDAYHRLLTVYQRDVQEQIVTELSSVNAASDNGDCREINADAIREMQNVIREFLHNTNVICLFLKGCVEQAPGFGSLVLLREELYYISELRALISAFKCLQRETVYMLEQWRKEVACYAQQQMMN